MQTRKRAIYLPNPLPLREKGLKSAINAQTIR